MKKVMYLVSVLAFAVLLASCGKNPVLSMLPEASGTSGGSGSGNTLITGDKIQINPKPIPNITSATMSMTIKAGQTPIFSWNYNVSTSGNPYVSLNISKNNFRGGSTDASDHYWVSRPIPIINTSVMYGAAAPGSPNVDWAVPAKTLVPGEYGVWVYLYDSTYHLNGGGVCSLIVE